MQACSIPQALGMLELDIADKAFVRCHDYHGIEFVRRLQALDNKALQQAQLAVYAKVGSILLCRSLVSLYLPRVVVFGNECCLKFHPYLFQATTVLRTVSLVNVLRCDLIDVI
jgi:hypothetical protein